MGSLKKLKLIGIFLFIFTLAGLVSCNKKTDETSDQKVNEADLETVSTNNFTETDEDLLSVDYKEFYDELAPHGEWIEVKGNDIGVDLKKNTSSDGHRTISISDLFGVKEAYADVDFGAFFVWQPAPGLAVGLTTGETDVAVTPAYVPYSNGQWINTTNGWYFRAASEPEEITSHYGRWVLSPNLGWVWLPGRVWSPAWVDWREQDEFIAWEPVPPSFYLVNNVIVAPPVYEDRYIVVEKRYFIEPEVYKYMYKENKNKIMIKEWRRLDGVMVVNQTVINRGPEVSVIQSYYGGTPISVVTINPVPNISQVSYTSAEYRVFSPEFKKVKTKHKVDKVISTPKKFDKFESASGKYETGKNKGKTDQGKENIKGNENKNNKGNDNFKENRKYIDDGKMKDGGKNKNNGNNKNNNNNTQKKDNGKKDNGNKDNGKKDNGKKDNGNKDNGNKEKIDKKGNDNKSNGKNDKGNKKYRKDQSNGQNKGNDQNKVKGQNKGGNNDKGSKNNNGSEKKQNNGSKNKGNKK